MRVVSSVLALAVFGLLSAQTANAALYTTTLSSAGESPADSPGTGFATVQLDTVNHLLTVDVTFSGLLGTTTASHIHAPTATAGTGSAGVATQTPTFSGFPLGVTAGTYHNVFDTTLASSWNASYITSSGGTPLLSEAALSAALNSEKAYLNIHTSNHTGGEIRGFLVPEPSAMTLFGVSALGLLARRRALRQAVAETICAR